MISQLPRWVWSFAWALAFAGGMVNVVGVLGFEHQTVTHLTGTTSMLAAALADLNGAAAMHFGAMIGSFVLGTVLSGLIIKDSALKLGRRYGVALVLEALLLAVAVPLLNHDSMSGLYSAACACGLQNAMASTYSGTVVRTTHLSGMFTDLGVFLGHSLRGLPIDQRRLRLSVLIISGFLSGGVVGAVVYRRFGNAALYVPAAFTAMAALAYEIYRIRQSRRAAG